MPAQELPGGPESSTVPPSQLPRRRGDLDAATYPAQSVRDEVRRNLIDRLRRHEPIFDGVVGYDETVVPQVVNALLARHDLILLGLRGQAKTRLCRQITRLLDEWTPVVPGCPLRSHPLAPVTEAARRKIREQGDDLEIEWVHRDDRYGEKLATPDVTMADLIGDIDPLKAAHRRLDLSDPEVIHFGILPRTNRGVFNINELPDLAPRIQVGLLNVLEERDVQIRGFPLRIPLDALLVFTANPEDYTNRGSIITPLKDRIASQILTHYPRNLDDALEITEQEAWLDRGGDLPEIEVPMFLREVVEEIAFQGRESEYVDPSSGVSARLPIAARELLASQVERRQLLHDGQSGPYPRLVDITQITPAITGKVELVYEGEQEGSLKVARHLVGTACRIVFDRYFPDVIQEGREENRERRQSGRPGPVGDDRYKPILDWFARGDSLELADSMHDEEYRDALASVPGLEELARTFLEDDSSAVLAAGMELVLEGLHQHSLLAKEDMATGTTYSDMLGIMLEGL